MQYLLRDEQIHPGFGLKQRSQMPQCEQHVCHWSWLYRWTSGVKIFFWPHFGRNGVLKSDVEVPEMSSLPSNSSVALEEDVLPNTTFPNMFLLYSHLQPSFILVVTCSSRFLFSFSFFSSFLSSPAVDPLLPGFYWVIKKFQSSRISIIWRAFAWDIEQIWKIWSEKLLYFCSVSLFSCFCLKVYPL